MEASILIVSKNRKMELFRTLKVLEKYLDPVKHEIRVFLDACTDDSIKLKSDFPTVHWMASQVSLGASRARNILYKTAKGKLLFGFDDDAHPLQNDFIDITQRIFDKNPKAGIIGFKEIRGIFMSSRDIPKNEIQTDYLVNDFIGCGFVVRKEIYLKTRGFPIWIDIYGEEVCLALEVLDLGFDIIYTNKVKVNHRVDKEKRKANGINYFRFGKQLKNTSYFYQVYYPPLLALKKISRLYLLNFKKYALKDRKYFQQFWRSFFINIININHIQQHRQPVKKKTLQTFNELSKPQY